MLAETSTVKIAPEQTIDCALLFHRFLVVSMTGDLSIAEIMSYELSPYTSALLGAINLFRKADKPQLTYAISDHSSKVLSEAMSDPAPKTEQYVLDGGSLVHRFPWKTGDSYGMIAQSYANFTIHHYGSATVIFDG